MTAVALAACGRLTARQRPFTASCKQHAQLPTRRRPAAATGGGSDGGSGELPPELQDLCISEDGQYLIDNKTGKVVNEFGATRFDVAVRAMRGEFDPPADLPNTERQQGLLLDSLTQWPAVYQFQLVVKQQPAAAAGEAAPASGEQQQQQQGSSPEQALLKRYRSLIADTTAADISPQDCTAKPRMGGRYVSLCIPARVQAAHVMDLVWAALADDPAVIMKY
ncbi:lipoate regulatory [Micractinium conductrix]|uniref:Lipoate regulatory n=1 Tax=Micractinium conductrix TaxID=554055 RepID=A0A2P6V1V6_9CHLO|nr:lipoate regulatory [Micractinium conductrix]|eukprot:PSC68065.1 lipoate regulatory [Micractinium conductrix]